MLFDAVVGKTDIPNIGTKAFFMIFYGYGTIWALLHLCIAILVDVACGGDAPAGAVALQHVVAFGTALVTLRLIIRRMAACVVEADRN